MNFELANLEACKFLIKGNGGKKTLTGEVKIDYSKNASLVALGLVPLFNKGVILKNIPKLNDTYYIFKILESFGYEIKDTEDQSFSFDLTSKPKSTLVPVDMTKKTRAGIVAISTLLARFGEVECVYPGGCVIGKRPIDFLIDIYKLAGASVEEKKEEDKLRIFLTNGLNGFEYTFKKKSVTITAIAVFLAIVAKGNTTLKNCAIEPEITSIFNQLKDEGFKIKGINTETLEIEGNGGLIDKSFTFTNIPDRIQTDSFLVLSLLAGYDIRIKDCLPSINKTEIELLKKIGFSFDVYENEIYIPKENKDLDISKLNPISIETKEYPLFPTDAQTVFSLLATQINGKSSIKENIFENRIEDQAEELRKFKTNIKTISKNELEIMGATPLIATEVNAIDLRSAFTFLLAGLIAEGDTTLNNCEILFRGYENIETQINNLSANKKLIEKI